MIWNEDFINTITPNPARITQKFAGPSNWFGVKDFAHTLALAQKRLN